MVISALPLDVVTNLPVSILQARDYEQLKQSVLSAYERTKPELLEKLMKTTGRPSVYLQNNAGYSYAYRRGQRNY